MGTPPLAFSVHHFITTVGSDAGFASIIGLAVLVLLYFSHARETATLRDRAEESSRRLQELEHRLAQLARQGAAAQGTGPVVAPPPPGATSAGERSGPAPRAPRPAAMPRPSSRSALEAAPATPSPVPAAGSSGAAVSPGAPAGVGAPALSAATRMIPSPPGASPEPVSGADTDLDQDSPEELTAVSGPAPVTVAGAGNGAGQQRVTPPPASIRQGPAGPPRLPLRPAAAGAGKRPTAAPGAAPPPSRARRGLVLLLGALGVAAVVAVLLIVTAGGGKQTASTPSAASNAPTAHHGKRAPAFSPSSVTVAVLNGTATTGLAHRTATRLASDGYKEGTIATASDQTLTATVVAYMPGHHSDAVQVARSLKVGSGSVQPVDANTQAVACPPPSACTSTVVVTVGSDLASG